MGNELNKDQALKEFINLVIKNAPEYDNFSVYDLHESLNLTETEHKKFKDLSFQIRKSLVDDGIAILYGSRQIKLTEYGRHLRLNLEIDKSILIELNKLKQGEAIPQTKHTDTELYKTFDRLINLGVLKKEEHLVKLKNLKLLSKVIELKSIDKFINWNEDSALGKTTITNNFTNSNVGQFNQSTEKVDSKNNIKQGVNTKKRSILEIITWIIGIIAGSIAIYEFFIKQN
ncbi:hypothetical protein OOZ15_04810 [Galbibacter sp. EGI 63066]|uniref:hypothetical protein n=1 Tax=Galbibacter sp. EGI 63066 TaxID=2993559 RepID=UPI0022490C2B|nr:hypothetical protein [Galbibacter sp. EGI 63066]MCX2679255.1 hypothetical protein [Galbibacter sp. EGI 63066]